MSALFAGLLGIGYSMLAKLVGYNFVTTTLCIGLKSWAESTASHHDDEVVEAIEKALKG